MKHAEKEGEPKFSYVSVKEKWVSAKAGGKYLIVFEFVILMRDKIRNFNN